MDRKENGSDVVGGVVGVVVRCIPRMGWIVVALKRSFWIPQQWEAVFSC